MDDEDQTKTGFGFRSVSENRFCFPIGLGMLSLRFESVDVDVLLMNTGVVEFWPRRGDVCRVKSVFIFEIDLCEHFSFSGKRRRLYK